MIQDYKIGKRGQVTIFIIVGIIIVFAAFFVGYLQNENFRQRIESTLFGKFVVPEQAQSVVNYLDDCIYDLASDGIRILGNQGGYIELPALSSRQYLQADPLTKIPYWIYGSKFVVPSAKDMQDQLKDYINLRANLECDFQQFQDYTFYTKVIDVNPEILNGKVSIKLNSDINVNIKENNYALKDYIIADIPVDLKLLHEMSIDIVNRELRRSTLGNAPFEALTTELIASYSKSEDDRIDIPPMSKFDYGCNPKTWLVEDVKRDVKEILSDNLRFLRVEGVNNADYGANYVNLVVDNVFDRNHNDVSIDFNYDLSWPMSFDVQPRNGAVLKPDTLKLGLPFMPLFCFSTYSFRYSLQYPIMINLEKDNFIFRFPIEVFVLNNYAGRNIEGEILDADFPDITTRFCDENQKLSGNIKVITADSLTGRPLDDAQISYNCGVNNCVVGNTKLAGGESSLNGAFPLCQNGEIQLSKEGYGDLDKELTTFGTGPQEIFGIMKPIIEKDVELRVIEINNGVSSERKLRNNEVASVQFNALENGEVQNQLGAVFEGDTIEKVELLPDNEYNILINLILNDEITIPAGKYQGVDIPSQQLDNVLLGGADYEVYIRQDDLINNEKVIIYAISMGIPTNYENYVENFDVRALSDINRGSLELRFE